MEQPVQYLTILRRRWWVIAAAVAVAVATAWFVTSTSQNTPVTSSTAAYSATTVLWDPGTPTQGAQTTDTSGSITGMDALAQVVKLPDVVAIAAQIMHYKGSPLTLRNQVQAAADKSSGFLDITGYGADPTTAETVSTSFSQALRQYLEQIKTGRINQQQAQLQVQIDALKAQGAGPLQLAPLRAALSQLALDRAAPISLTIIQGAKAEPAAAPGFKPPKSRGGRALLAAILGLLAGIALALVLERFDTRIRTRADAEAGFGLPVLAEVPDISRRWRKQVVTATHPMSRAAASFRLLGLAISRTSAAAAGGSNGNGQPKGKGSSAANGRPPKTIVVTSPEPRDGKTTVAANLAAAYAEVGRRVLVVSCDLRRPDIERLFGVPNRPGLAEALAAIGNTDHAETRFDLLPYIGLPTIVMVAVMPSGAASHRYVELLGSDQMEQLLEHAQAIADVVILDCAPLLVASDVVPLLAYADAVVVVARAGKTRGELATRTTELLTRLGGKVAGVVLNDANESSVPLARRRYYRYHGYYRAPKRDERVVRVDEPVAAREARDDAREMWPAR